MLGIRWCDLFRASGEVQCRALHDRIFGGGLRRKPDPAMAALRKCKLVVVSPLLRALQTAGLVFGREGDTDDGADLPEVVVWPSLTEQVLSSGEIGRPGPALLADPKVAPALAAFPSLRAQLADLPDQWWGPQTAADLPDGLWLPKTRSEAPSKNKKNKKTITGPFLAHFSAPAHTHTPECYSALLCMVPMPIGC